MRNRKEMVKAAAFLCRLANASHQVKVESKRKAVDYSRGIERFSFVEGEMFFTPNGADEVYIGRCDGFTMTVKL